MRMISTGYKSVAGPHLLLIAWLVALVASLGALFIGEVLGRTPCLLCWYQRIAMFPLALILGAAFIDDDLRVGRYALPIASIGAALAAWHSALYAGLLPRSVEPCTRGGPSCSDASMTLFGVIPLPFLSLAAFAVILLAVVIAQRKAQHE